MLSPLRHPCTPGKWVGMWMLHIQIPLWPQNGFVLCSPTFTSTMPCKHQTDNPPPAGFLNSAAFIRPFCLNMAPQASSCFYSNQQGFLCFFSGGGTGMFPKISYFCPRFQAMNAHQIAINIMNFAVKSKGLFTWRWGTPAWLGTPSQWGNQSLHTISLFS